MNTSSSPRPRRARDVGLSVRTAFSAAPRCAHTVSWPSVESLLSGIAQCPYCEADRLRGLCDQQARSGEQLSEDYTRLLLQMERVNATNAALQRLAIGLCRTSEQVEELRRINQG